MGSIQREEWCAGVYLTKLIGDAEDLEDFVSWAALVIALKAIHADGKMDEKTAETILEYVSYLAACMLSRAPELSFHTGARLETIRDTDPRFVDETKPTDETIRDTAPIDSPI